MQKVAGEPNSLEIGHAVSDDLVRWTTLDPALTPRPGPAPGTASASAPGTVVRHGGRYHLFYGAAPDMIDRVGRGDVDRPAALGALPRATPSRVADPRWYEHDATARPTGTVAWRDPCVRRDGDGWIMYLAARLNDGPARRAGRRWPPCARAISCAGRSGRPWTCRRASP